MEQILFSKKLEETIAITQKKEWKQIDQQKLAKKDSCKK